MNREKNTPNCSLNLATRESAFLSCAPGLPLDGVNRFILHSPILQHRVIMKHNRIRAERDSTKIAWARNGVAESRAEPHDGSPSGTHKPPAGSKRWQAEAQNSKKTAIESEPGHKIDFCVRFWMFVELSNPLPGVMRAHQSR